MNLSTINNNNLCQCVECLFDLYQNFRVPSTPILRFTVNSKMNFTSLFGYPVFHIALISFGIFQDCAMSGDLESSVNEEFVKYEYHVIYSISYNVPVLYFTASRQGNLYWDLLVDIDH